MVNIPSSYVVIYSNTISIHSTLNNPYLYVKPHNMKLWTPQGQQWNKCQLVTLPFFGCIESKYFLAFKIPWTWKINRSRIFYRQIIDKDIHISRPFPSQAKNQNSLRPWRSAFVATWYLWPAHFSKLSKCFLIIKKNLNLINYLVIIL